MKKMLHNRTIQDGIVVLGLGLALLIHSVYKFTFSRVKASWIMSPYLFPVLLAVFTLILGTAIILEGRTEMNREAGKEPAPIRIRDVLVLLGVSVLYDVLMRFIGFIPSTILFLLVLIWFLGEKNWKVLLAVAVLTPLVLYAIFKLGLNVKLP